MTLPGQPAGISQTSFIFATVFVAYLIFITLRGDLVKWLSVFGFGPAPPSQSTNSTDSTMGGLTGGAGSQLSSAISGTGIFGGGTDLARQYGSGSSGASSALALAAFA